MSNVEISKLLEVVLPLVVGLIVPVVLDLLKRTMSWLDQSPTFVKQGAAFAIAGLATVLTQVAGIAVPAELASWDTTLVQTLVAALLGIAIKQQKQVTKLKAPKAKSRSRA